MKKTAIALTIMALALTACVREVPADAPPTERTTVANTPTPVSTPTPTYAQSQDTRNGIHRFPAATPTPIAIPTSSASLVSQKATFVEWLLLLDGPLLAESVDETSTPEEVGVAIDGVCLVARYSVNAADFTDSAIEHFSPDQLEDGGYSLIMAGLLTGCEEEGERLFGE